jgi:hypothetical protein
MDGCLPRGGLPLSALMATAPNRGAGTPASPPWKLPSAVRAAPRITISDSGVMGVATFSSQMVFL